MHVLTIELLFTSLRFFQNEFWGALTAMVHSTKAVSDNLENEVAARQAGEKALHGRIDQVNDRVDGVESKTNALEARIAALEAPNAPRKPVRNDGFQPDLANTPLLEPFWLVSEDRPCKRCLASKTGRCALPAHNP